MRVLSVKREAERRFRIGHAWVYANEIDGKLGSMGLIPGELVEIVCRDQSYGAAYVNPNTLIAARLLRAPAHGFEVDTWLAQRLRAAIDLRARLGLRDQCRLVFGESDGLPGLVVDRYGSVLSAQITTAGMERMRTPLAAALKNIAGIGTIVWRNDASSRALEGLAGDIEIDGAADAKAVISEGDARFAIAPATGQKTGWFYDQRDNRARVLPHLKGLRVLDLFSYLGGWGIGAVCAGAREAWCVDSSESAVDAVRRNASLSGVANRVHALKADAFDACRQFKADGQSFDAIVVDPPAFIKRKKDYDEGALAYRRINEAALRLLAPGGLLISCSCSHHFDEDSLQDALRQAAHSARRSLSILMRLAQSADHPEHPAMPETRYLKGFACAVL